MNYLGMLIVTEDRPFVKSPHVSPVDNSPNLPHRGRGTAAPLFYGIAATGSYFRFNSLRDAPPGGEAFNLPLRGRGTAAAVEEGRYGRERCVLISRSLPQRPSSVSLTRASSPEGEAFNLPLRGRGTAVAVEEGCYGRERCVFISCSRPQRPSSVSLTRASTAFYGIAATGSYFRFNSLRDAPPGGEAFNLPLRGRGTAAAVEEGRYGRERCVFISRSRPQRPSSVSLTRASSPGGEAFNLPLRGRGTAAAVEEGCYGRERCVISSRSRPEGKPKKPAQPGWPRRFRDSSHMVN